MTRARHLLALSFAGEHSIGRVLARVPLTLDFLVPMRDSGERDHPRQYFFVVTRSRPDILARARECLGGNPGIEVIADRRVGERRLESAPCAVERRVSGRRRAGEPALDDRIHPTLFVRRHVPTYAELQQQVTRLEQEIANLNACLQALTAAEAIRRTSGALAAVADRLATQGLRMA